MRWTSRAEAGSRPGFTWSGSRRARPRGSPGWRSWTDGACSFRWERPGKPRRECQGATCSIIELMSATPGPPPEAPALVETTQLLALARDGDRAARDRLFARFLPRLEAWSHRRLPHSARGLADTDDLVQVTLVRALNRLHAFEPQREGAFLSYLRTILLNVVREEIRRARPLLRREEPGEDLVAPSRSQLEVLIGAETMERYEEGLVRLPDEQRE